jgi:hypothetical protein
VLGKQPHEGFLEAHEIRLSTNDASRLTKLVEAQYYRQAMYASCVYFFPMLGSYTTRYGIANAAYAIRLTREATGIDLGPQFKRDLAIAVGSDAQTGKPVRASDMYDEAVSGLPGT